jgi:site-specific DNA recombinase
MTAAVLRCAIYTRVSSDSGLEQDFNSLDAQRESAEAYIKSQAHEGWRLVRDHFDDGGFSGGSMERPALQKLLDRIRERRIDVVVVYKVDRLTRSLADFAKLVELFDAHKVSFVSVTQAFNTTTSMGRLTLNVLLSFAQFEREVTGERIRDKIAASKKKGLWMGGVVPYGYRVEDRRLHVVDEEAEIVRLIFDLYLAHGSVRSVQRELRHRNVRSRVRNFATGKTIGGVFFTNGPISHILRNRHYLGEINHRDKSWPGEHQPIIDREKFDRVQDMLAGQRRARIAEREKSQALLLGKIFNNAGERMTPSYALKKGVRYRYYVSVSAMQSRDRAQSSLHRIPADAVEEIVINALAKARSGRDRSTFPQETAVDNNYADRDAAGGDIEIHELLDSQLERVVVHANRLEIALRPSGETDAPAQNLIVPWTKPSGVRQRQILEPETPVGKMQPLAADERNRLLRAIALARNWLNELIQGAVADFAAIAKREKKSERSIRMTLSLAFLDPALIRAAVENRLPRGYGVSRMAELPPDFDDQWRALGLTKPR